MPGRHCLSCSHREASQITKDIVAGVSFRDIAARYGISKDSADRHAQNCLKLHRSAQGATNAVQSTAKKLAPSSPRNRAPSSSRIEAQGAGAPEPSPARDPQQLLQRAWDLCDDASEIMTRALGAGSDRLALSALREIRSSVELAMRAHGMLTSENSTQVTVIMDQRRRADELLSKMTEADLRALIYGPGAVASEVIDVTPVPLNP